jgi:hypothetical protein
VVSYGRLVEDSGLLAGRHRESHELLVEVLPEQLVLHDGEDWFLARRWRELS